MYDIFLFDLDGTLTESGEGIINSIRYALRSFGIEENDNEKLTSFLGPSLYDSFALHYGFTAEQSKVAVAKYREYFAEFGMWENRLYDGISDLLRDIVASGKIAAIATAKPTYFATQIVEKFGIAPYISFVSGSELDGKRSDKCESIKYALEHLDSFGKKIVMIGDRKHDVLGALVAGVDIIGVSYGYGSCEELVAAGAEKIADNVVELREILNL
jgi:phosphoglycolate phosphatase